MARHCLGSKPRSSFAASTILLPKTSYATMKAKVNMLFSDSANDRLNHPSPRSKANKTQRRAHKKSQRNRRSDAGSLSSIPICPYCRNPAKLITGQELYPHRPDLFKIKVWQCAPCDARVGCHRNGDGTRPLGRLANAELRVAKQQAHAAFDPIWKARSETSLTRKEAYAWLSEQLDINFKDCHIGEFDVIQCRKVVAICKTRQ